MASTARELRYRSSHAVNGSLAYDLDYAVRERELRHAGEAPRRQETVREKPKTKVHAAPRVQVREQEMPVSLFTIVGITAAIGMAVLLLICYTQLTVLSADTVELQSQLSTLETENVTLTAEYEQMFDLATVKEAAEAAGMTKPGNSQICYIDLSGGDSAVVYQKEDPSVLSKILASLNHGIYAVVEYFD